MKILFCIDTMTKGGAERVIANLSNYLINEQKVEILTLLNRKCQYEIDNNVKIYSLNISEKRKNILEKFIYTLNNVKEYCDKIKEINPDIIISFLPRSSYYSIIAAKLNRKKIIVSDRNDPNIEYRDFINRTLMKALYKKADGFVFQTEEAKKYFKKKIQNKSVVIPNPINEKFLCNSYSGEREKIIVTVGRLTEQKNQILLINAFKEISKKYSEYKLFIYGEGPLKDSLTRYIEKEGLRENVILKGIANNIKEEIYKKKMFVLTSNYEGMPNALMEAMGIGLPVISTDCPIGGPKFLIKNGNNGLLVKVNDNKNLEESIIRIIEDESLEKKISLNAAKSMKKLKPKIINEKWKEYIYTIGEKE